MNKRRYAAAMYDFAKQHVINDLTLSHALSSTNISSIFDQELRAEHNRRRQLLWGEESSFTSEFEWME